MSLWRRVTQYEVITRDDTIDYLARWRLLRTPWFCLYLHRFLASDDACMHDHPWAFISLVISGGYWEEWISFHGVGFDNDQLADYMVQVPDVRWEIGGVDGREVWQIRRRWRGRGSLAQHPATYIHRVDGLHATRPTYTLILRTRRSRVWGFRTPTGWVPHHEYSAKEHC